MAKIQLADLPEKVQEIIHRIVEGYHPEKIIIFGSYARGDWTEDSDLDVLVVKETDERPFDRIGSVSAACWPRSIPMDIVVKTPREIEGELEEKQLFTREIMREGVLVHDGTAA